MSSAQPSSPWGPADISTVGPDAGTQGAVPGGAPDAGGPKKRWPYLVLIAVSLVVVTAGATVIALSLTGKDDQVATSESAPSPDLKDQSPTTGSADSDGDARAEDNVEGDSDVTLPDRTAPSTLGASGDGPASTSPPRGSTGGVAGTGDHTLGAISFDVPSGFTPTMVAERRDDGALRSEFQGPGGQEIVIEVNPDNSSDGFETAQELAGNFRDQGRLIHEPYSDSVGGHTTGVLAIRGTSGDSRSDHFLSYAGYGIAVMGIDPSSFDAADSLAYSVLPTLQG